MSFAPGRMLLHYRLVEQIGAGGMGVVWRAEDTKLDRSVALKFLSAEVAADAARIQRFEQEAKTVAALNHPNIVTVHAVERVDEHRFIAMELVEGPDLSCRIPESGLELGALLDIAIPLADALSAAHERGVAHRDIKPANIALGPDERVKILDFGLAKLNEPVSEDEPTRTVTEQGKIVGTLAYMSPEQLENQPVDGRTDIFALGIVLHEMATGRRPCAGTSSAGLISQILREVPPPVTESRSDLPTHLARVINRCLEKEPDRRYQTAGDLRRELTELRHEAHAGEPRAERRGMRSRWAPLMVGAVTLVAVVAVVLQALRLVGESSSPALPAPQVLPLAVMGFENLSDPTDADRIGRMLMGLISTDLAETGGLTVVSTSRVMAALRDVMPSANAEFEVATAIDAARRAGAELMLAGQIGHSGERLVLTAELSDVSTGAMLGSIREEASSGAELFSLAGVIASQVRQRLSIDINDGVTFDLAESLTTSEDAYRHYAAGEAAMHRREWRDAIGHFQLAIDVDPTFAMAYYRLSMSQGWLGVGARNDTLRRGLRYVDRLPERWQVIYRWAASEVNHDALKSLVEGGVDIADAHYQMGEHLIHSSRCWDPTGALWNFDRALELDPSFTIVLLHLTDLMIMADEISAVRRLVEALRRTGIDGRSIDEAELNVLAAEGRLDDAIALGEVTFERWREGGYPLGRALILRGDWERAERACDNMARAKSGYPSAMSLYHATVARIAQGRLRTSVRDLLLAASGFSERPDLGGIGADIALVAAQILAVAGESTEALAAVDEASEIDPDFPWSHFWRVRLLRQLGRQEEARATVDELTRMNVELTSPQPGYVLQLLEAESALEVDDLRSARSAIDRARSYPVEVRRPSIDASVLGKILVAAGDDQSALLAFKELSRIRSRWDLNVIDETLALYELGRLSERLGDASAAASYYQAFLTRWGDADVDIDRVRDAKVRLSSQPGERP